MNNTYKNQLKNIDKELIQELEKLPLDYWDFKNEDTKELTHGIHTYPAVMVYPISRNIIKIVKKYQKVQVLMDPFMGSGTCLVEGILQEMDEVYGTDLNPLARLISKVKTTHLHYEDVRNTINELEDKINTKYNENKILLDNIYSYLEENFIDITEKQSVKKGWGCNAPNILREYISKYDMEFNIPEFKNIGFWFVPNAIIELQIIKSTILGIENENIRNFMWVVFSEVTRLVSNRRNSEFKMYRMPAEKVAKFRPDVKKEFFKILERNAEKMHKFYDICDSKSNETKVHILSNDTRELQDIPNECIDLVVTSPPYGDSRTTVAYGEFSRVSLQWANLEELSEKEITGIDKNLMGGTKFKKGFEFDLHSSILKKSLDKILEDENNVERAGDVYSFYKDLQDGIKSITKKCKLNSYQFWVVGNRTVKEENLKTSEIIIEMGQHYGLEHVYTIGRNIPNKVMPSLNSPTNEVGKKVATMTNEHIVVFRKVR